MKHQSTVAGILLALNIAHFFCKSYSDVEGIIMVLFRSVIVIGVFAFLFTVPVQAQTNPVVFYEGFETTPPSSFLSQYYGNLSSATRFSIQSEYRATGNSSLKHQFVAGSNIGEHITQHFGDSFAGPVLSNGGGNHYNDLYVQFKIMYSEGYDWSAGNNKIMIIGTQDDRSHDNICCNPWVSHYITILAGGTGNQGYFNAEGNNKRATTGQWFGIGPNYSGYSSQNHFMIVPRRWYTIEVRKRLNTLGQMDGIFQMWIDGTKVAEYTNLEYRVPWNGESGANSNFGTNFIMLTTYINNDAPQNQSVYYDDIAISTSYIGTANNVTPPGPPTNLRIAN